MSTSREAHLVELVDDAGRPVGERTVEEAHRAPGLLHRAFSVLLVDDAGRLLLQRRAAVKTRFPLRWANSCCGHPPPGQQLRTAANRRLAEELGAPAVPLTEIGVHLYRATDPATGRVEHEYDHVLRGILSPDVPLRPDPDEVAELRWVDPEELRLDLLARPARYAPWLAGVVGGWSARPRETRIRPTGRRSGRVGFDALSAGVVARRLGVAVTTLRTWHQRYGLGPSDHLPGQHRRYTPADLARLEIMRRLTAEGISPAEAAHWARHASDVLEPDLARRREQWTTPPARDHGGSAIAAGRASPAARGLARAAMRMDAAGMGSAIERAIANIGVVSAWDKVVRPALAAIGDRHATSAGLIGVEHLLSRSVSEALAAVPRPAVGTEPPRILLACAEEEQHTLPLEALAAALAEAGVGCRQLGARVPPTALVATVNRTGPAAVAIWSHSRTTGDPAQLVTILASRRRPPLVLAAGPGWRVDPLPVEVPRPATLGEAVALLLAAPGQPRRAGAAG